MLLIVAFAAGAALGYWRASARGGAMQDKLQYAVVHGIVATLAVFALATLADWWGLVG